MKKLLLVLPLLFVIAISCEEEANPLFDAQNFTAIFDNNQFTATYNPVDIIQTSDEGYIVLGKRDLTESAFAGIYLLKADKYGNFVKETEVDAEYVHPIASLAQINGKIYFICMNELTTQAYIVEISFDAEIVEATLVEEITYPNSASVVGTQYAIQGYNHVDKLTQLFLANVDGSVAADHSFTIGIGDTESLDKMISDHYLETGTQLPFAIGKAGGLYYFNGFYDFTFSMLFSDLNNEEPQGGVQGQRESDNSGLSAIVPISGTKFAVSWFNVGSNYFNPDAIISTAGDPSSIGSDDFQNAGLPFRELVPNADVRILRAQADGKNVLIYASTTLSKQIGLFFYDEVTGVFISSRYLGFSNPFEMAALVQTSDGGLAVCGTTHLAGRFPRICIFKLSKEELAENLK